jgi:hypothetical protein
VCSSQRQCMAEGQGHLLVPPRRDLTRGSAGVRVTQVFGWRNSHAMCNRTLLETLFMA